MLSYSGSTLRQCQHCAGGICKYKISEGMQISDVWLSTTFALAAGVLLPF
jgi:hypothetical protein